MTAPGLREPDAVRTGVPVAAATVAPRRRRGVRRTVVVAGLVALVLLALVGAGAFALSERLGGNVDRVPGVFSGLDANTRPPATGALTFLLVGTDTRSDAPTTGTDAGGAVSVGDRSDVLMVAQVAPDRRSATVVSIPRDSWVDIPGRGMNKINAAYAFGGPNLLVRTVEKLTALHVDHFAVVDFAGFSAMVDAVGGIDVGIAAPTSSDGVDFHQGVNHLDGRQALAYVRQRHGLADGDLDRAQRQQNALRAVLNKAASGGTLADPTRLYGLLDATSRSVGVDDTLGNGGLRSLALALRDLRPGDVSFLRAPVQGLGREGAQSVVHLDPERAGRLWNSLRQGTAIDYVQQHPADVLGPATR